MVKRNYQVNLDPSNHSSRFLQNVTEDTYYGEETPEFARTARALKEKKPYRKFDKGGKWIASYNNRTYWIEARWQELPGKQ